MERRLDYNIVYEFLSPSVRDRIIYELSSPKKTIKALERFSHSAESIIRTEYLCYKGRIIQEKIISEIKNSVSEFVVLSPEYQQGKNMSAEEALDYLIDGCSFAVVADEGWLIIKPEHEGGEGLFYVLRKDLKR